MKKPSYSTLDTKKPRHFLTEKLWLLPIILLVTTFITILLLMSSFNFKQPLRMSPSPPCPSQKVSLPKDKSHPSTPIQLQAILHYSTSHVVPQQSRAEITLTFNVLQSITPCNFLVFGLGHDSLMWTSLNPQGTTLFLEEDPKWIKSLLQRFPTLQAHLVKYPTHLSQANHLLSTYKNQKACLPPNATLKNNTSCKLAISILPSQVYDTEWDIIMIDAPRGYFNEAPGRMGVIYTAAVMSRARTRPGVTHVFLHDVNRRVERVFAEEFLCRKYLVGGVERLWHFEIPPANVNDHSSSKFC